MNEYEQQAADFLAKTGTKFSCVYEDYRPYFADEKQYREVYKFRLSRGRKAYSGLFGQSIANTGTAPTAYAILSSLTKSDPGSFDDFCSDFGYDNDSRSAERTYKAVLKEWAGVSKLFTEEEIELLQQIN